MLSTFDDASTIRRRARGPLLAAAAITGATVSPPVVAIFDDLIVRPTWTVHEVAFWYAWIALCGGVLAVFAVTRAWRGVDAPRGASIVGWSALAGLALPALLITPTAAVGASHDLLELLKILVLGVPCFTLFAGIFSAPIGAMFGLVFSSGVSLARDRIERPAHDTVGHAWASATLVLAVATSVSVVVATLVERAYCYELFFRVLPALEVVPRDGTDAAWTRFVVLPAPLALATLVFGVVASIARWRLARAARAILAGTHPIWIADGSLVAAPADALPLRALDREAKEHLAIRPRKTDSVYRDGRAPMAFIAR